MPMMSLSLNLKHTFINCVTKVTIVMIFMYIISGGPRIEVRGQICFLGKVANGAKWSHANEVSFKWLGSRACLRALEALGVFFAEYVFSLFSRYLSVLFLK